jgi:ring-1,2-phenylacetyl-CoA epoxidase subunit PaaB
MIWEVFRRGREGGDFVYCRDVHAPDRELAKQFAVIQHGRRKPTDALWVAPQSEILTVDADAEIDAAARADAKTTDADRTEWAVFSPDRRGYHTHRGAVTAADETAATRDAIETFGEADEELWLVDTDLIGEVTGTDAAFGGTTNKDYRFAQTYNVDPAAEEVAASETEQVEAKRNRGES